ncbi:MAG: hypothetical protein QG599_1965 [Pseudomonadota bacterium]|nr:hypothetical protein [Pseudomonadota bacterium]
MLDLYPEFRTLLGDVRLREGLASHALTITHDRYPILPRPDLHRQSLLPLLGWSRTTPPWRVILNIFRLACMKNPDPANWTATPE